MRGTGSNYPKMGENIKNIGDALGGVAKGVGNWIGKGAPLPGATKPPAGKSYLRGRLIPSYKKGGIVKKTGLALVHKGEKVTPVEKAMEQHKCEDCKKYSCKCK